MVSYLKEVPQARIACDRQEKEGWLIHIYEIIPEENDLPSHTATFGWYLVTPEGIQNAL